MNKTGTRKVSFKPEAMKGGRKNNSKSSSDEEESEERKGRDDRDPSQLQDLLENAENQNETENDSDSRELRLKLKKKNAPSNAATIVDETTKKIITVDRLESEDGETSYSLHDLAKEGDVVEMRRLLCKLRDNTEMMAKFVNETDEDKFTPIHYAVRYNRYEVAKLLINNGADVKATADGGITPLHYCARYKLPTLSARSRKRPTATTAPEKVIKVDNTEIPNSTALDHPDNNEAEEFFTCRQSLMPKTNWNLPSAFNQAAQSFRFLPAAGIGAYRMFENDENRETVLIINLLIENKADIEVADKAGMTPLHYAATQGNTVFVGELLQCSANVNAQDRQNQTPLHCACASGSAVVCQQLLDSGAKIDCLDSDSKTPLHLACQFGKLSIVRLLLDYADPSIGENLRDQSLVATKRMRYGQLIDARDHENNTPLILAVENRNCEVACVLLERGADVNAIRKGGVRCLHLACRNGDLPMMNLLIDQGAKIDCRDIDQQTPMHVACANNKAESVQCLMDRGLEVRLRDEQGRTPLLTAVITGSLDCVKCISARFMWSVEDVDKFDRSALFLAAKHNRLDIVKFLITDSNDKPDKKDQDGNKTNGQQSAENQDVCQLSQNVWLIGRDQLEFSDRDNNTPMHAAASKGYSEVVECLLANGAGADAKNENEKTPMHLAAQEGRERVVRLFLGAEATRKTILEQDEDSNTPLHLAAMHGHALVAKALLEHGSDVRARNSSYWTALDYAADRGWSTTAEILLNYKAPVNLVDKTKATPLHIACSAGHTSIVKMLLQQKASVTALNCDNRSCLDLAIENERKHVVIQLISHPSWRSMLTHAYKDEELKQRVTPLRALIRNYPDIAKMVFEKCTKTSKLPPEHPNFEVTFDYELLEDTYSCWEADNDGFISYNEKHYLKPNILPYSANSAQIKRNHPLMIMVRREREDLLDHPLVRNLLKHKWRSYGRYVYYGFLLIYLLFLASLTAYVIAAKPPYYTFKSTPLDYLSKAKHICNRLRENATSVEQSIVDFAFSKQDSHVLVAKYLILFLAVLNILKEACQLCIRRVKYFSVENCIECFVYVAGFIFVMDFTSCSQITGYRTNWQWQLGAFSVFLAWFNLILFASKVPRFGIYVVMFTDVARTFSQFFLLYFLFIVAFALTFFALFQNQHPFSTVGSSIMKTIIMMVGDFDYEGIFTPVDTSYEDQVFYYKSSNFFFAVFVLVMTIMVMNLLIGLAVDDIKTIQQQAVLKRLALQVEQVLEVEQVVPEKFRRRWVINAETIKPNQRVGLSLFISKMFRFMGATETATRKMANAHATEGKLADRKLRALLESTNNKLDQLTRAVQKVQREQKKLKTMVIALSDKLDEEDVEEEFDEF